MALVEPSGPGEAKSLLLEALEKQRERKNCPERDHPPVLHSTPGPTTTSYPRANLEIEGSDATVL